MTRLNSAAGAPMAARPSVLNSARDLGARGAALAPLAAVLALVVWSYWPTAWGLWREWQRNPDYSVGQLVPLAALYLAWLERDHLRRLKMSPCWWGWVVLAAAEALRHFGLLFLYESAERYALVLATAGTVLLVVGRSVFWRLRWVVAFLVFMVPLPGRVHNLISGPLQDWATTGTVFVLELAGTYVVREGNVLSLNDQVPIGIEEACSGLRMLSAFIVVAAFFVLTVRRPRWQQAVLLLSSVPIALLCNVVRVVATVALFVYVGSAAAERFVHDFAGIAMMPLAVALLLVELWVLDRLVRPVPVRDATTVTRSRHVSVRAGNG